MTITETTEPATKPPVKRRRKTRKAGRRVTAAAPKSSEFAGLTAETCCTSCKPAHCVISGIGICGHPFKGALQTRDPEAAARFNRAKKAMGRAKLQLPAE